MRINVRWSFVVLIATLAGAGWACGPETEYCVKEHRACTAALGDQERDRLAAEAAAKKAADEAAAAKADAGGSVIFGGGGSGS